ncbi:MAG: aminopeptidase [Deltaproteobacteria bacterium]|nr:aminopeptidase [Deltaproteobacteria bacterium]
MSTREWPIAYWHYTPGPSSPIQMMKGALKCIKCGDVKEGETVLISTDTNKLRIAEVLAAAAYAVGATPIIIMIPPVGVHGAQLPEPIVAAFREADVFLQPTTWSQTHTKARVEAIKAGKRGSTMCEVTEDALCVGAINADYEDCDRRGRVLGAALAAADEIRVTTPLGTDVRGQVTGRPVQYETGLFKKPGQFAAFPDSEINISPIEGTTEGKIVSDVSIMSVGITLYDQVTLIVKQGTVVDIHGGMAASKLRMVLESLKDEKAYNYAEFGIGLNPEARLCATNLEDLGRLGNCHAGIGSNFAIGGKVLAPNHIDVMYKETTVYFDGKIVLDKGVLKI